MAIRNNLSRREFLAGMASVGAAAYPTLLGAGRANAQSPGPPTNVAVRAAGLLRSSDLTYVGSFRLPSGWAYYGGSNGGGGVVYNPANNSLFVGAMHSPDTVGEIAIPTPSAGTSFSALPRASLLQSPAEPTEGLYNSLDGDANTRPGGMIIVNGKLCVAWCTWYGTRGLRSHCVRPLNLSTKGQVAGWYQLGDSANDLNNNGWTGGGGMCLVPSRWQAALGGDMLVNCATMSITNAGMSCGPGALSLYSSAITGGANTHVECKALVAYGPFPNHLTLDGDGLSNSGSVYQHWNTASNPRDIVFPGGSTASVLFFGWMGTGPLYYGEFTDNSSLVGQSAAGGYPYVYDPTQAGNGHGNAAWPYRHKVWAYDANDLAAVKAGTKHYYDVMPYAEWLLPYPPWLSAPPAPSGAIDYNTYAAHTYGVTFDPSTRRVYAVVDGAESSSQERAVLVYQLPN